MDSKENLPERDMLERHCSSVKYLNPHTVNAAEIGLVMSVYLAPAVRSVLIITACICPLFKCLLNKKFLNRE